MSNFVDSIIAWLQFLGMTFGFIIGYSYGTRLSKAVSKSFVQSYYKSLMRPYIINSTCSEQRFFSIVAGLTGVLVGNYIWPIFLPFGAIIVQNKFQK